MPLIVQKYGGTSVGSIDCIKNVAQRVAKWSRAGYQMVLVLSAMSGETNRLLSLGRSVQDIPNTQALDALASTGEQVSVSLLVMALQTIGMDAIGYAGWQVPIKTDSCHTNARITSVGTKKIEADLAAGRVVVVTGFQGISEEGHVTTLGRGGSDTSAVAIAAALSAEECFIFTDVEGVYTTDPRVVSEAKLLNKITFEEMLELASLGARVLHSRSVELAGRYKVKTRVLSSLTPPDLPCSIEAKSGTLITFEEDSEMESSVVSGISFSRDEAKITLVGVPDVTGIAFKILGPIADAQITVDIIVQNQSVEGLTDFSFTMPRSEYNRALDLLHQIYPQIGAKKVVGDQKVAKVSAVGIGMRSHVGVASKMFQTLAQEGINIQMISTSEIKVSLVIEDKYLELAVRALHQAFNLAQNSFPNPN